MPLARSRPAGGVRPALPLRLDGVARREAIRAAVMSPGAELQRWTAREGHAEPSLRPPTPPPVPLPQLGTPPPRHERLIDLDELRQRLGGIGITLARRVLEELPVIRLGDRVLVREATLDEDLRTHAALARHQAAVR